MEKEVIDNMSQETGKLVIKKPSAAPAESDDVYKVDLTKKEDDAKVQKIEEGNELENEDGKEGVQEQKKEVLEDVQGKKPEEEEGEEAIIEKIVDDSQTGKPPVKEAAKEKVKEEIKVEPEVKEVVKEPEYPEDVKKLMDFLNDTNGSIEDYVRLNKDYSDVSDGALLKEYYKQTKPHLDIDDINFMIEDRFGYDEEVDEERAVRSKKLQYKDEVARAKQYLKDTKDKYYTDIKSGAKLPPEQKEAIDFYNQYKNEQTELSALREKQSDNFNQKTDKLFNDEFKGFEFKVNDDRYLFKIKDAEQVKTDQNDLFGAFKTFLNEDNLLEDATGYHKALFVARNSDKIISHFYEQGRADGIKEVMKGSKNVNMDARKQGIVDASGTKVRVLKEDSRSKLKLKTY